MISERFDRLAHRLVKDSLDPDQPLFLCPLCHDTGWIHVLLAEEVPDGSGRPYEAVRPCLECGRGQQHEAARWSRRCYPVVGRRRTADNGQLAKFGRALQRMGPGVTGVKEAFDRIVEREIAARDQQEVGSET